MTPEQIGVMGILFLFVLLAIRVPVALSMIVVSVIGYSWIVSVPGALAKLGSDSFVNARSYTLSVIPLFVLMGMFLSHAKMGSDLYRLFDVIFGRLRGGMAMATIGASALFSAVSGSAVATASTISSVAVKEMSEYNYSKGFSASCAAVGGTLGVLIPPSGALVLYGVLTEETIGGTLIGGILPGIMTAAMLIVTVSIILAFKPHLAPVVDKERSLTIPWDSLKYVWGVPLIFGVSMSGLYFGVFTPTEAGGVGAFVSLIFALLTGRLGWKGFFNALSDTARITAMIFLIVIGGKIFGSFLTISRIPIALTDYIMQLQVSPFVVVMIVFAAYVVMGAFMDELAILVIMTPIIYPIIIALGYNGVWFGVMTIMMLLTGLLTPPVGIVTLVVASITKVSPGSVFSNLVPFWITLILAGIIVALFPEIVLFLPGLM